MLNDHIYRWTFEAPLTGLRHFCHHTKTSGMLSGRQLLTIAEDLEYLRDHWENGAKGDELRRGSALLRRLLNEGKVEAAWNQLRIQGKPTISAPDLQALVGSQRPYVVVAQAGGAKVSGVTVTGGVTTGGVRIERDETPIRSWQLDDFLDSACIMVAGETLSRREVIKYMAIVEGGVHLQTSSKVRKKHAPFVRRVERIANLPIQMRILETEPLYLEILAIGQALANSSDMARLIAEIRSG